MYYIINTLVKSLRLANQQETILIIRYKTIYIYTANEFVKQSGSKILMYFTPWQGLFPANKHIFINEI